MQVEDIARYTDTIIRLDVRMWAWASLLGEARTASNDNKRHERADRGQFNETVDLVGALAELFLLGITRLAEQSDDAVSYMREHLYREGGGSNVKGPDLYFRDSAASQVHGIDVKSFDCSPNKSFFAINNNKHKSLAGECSAYFCVVTPAFGRRMAIARLVPYADVENWKEGTLRKGGSLSKNYPIEKFLIKYFSKLPDRGSLLDTVFPSNQIALAKTDPAIIAGLLKLVPNLEKWISARQKL